MQEQFANGVTTPPGVARAPTWALLFVSTANVRPSSKHLLQVEQILAIRKASSSVLLSFLWRNRIVDAPRARHAAQTEARPRPLALHFRPHMEQLSLPKYDEIIKLDPDLVVGQK